MNSTSKKSIAFGILFAGILASVAAVLQSGWTSTTNPATARTALAVPGLAVNNSFSGGNTFTSGVTNNSAAGFKGNGAGLTNVTAANWTGSVGTSSYVAKFGGSSNIVNSAIFESGGNVGIGITGSINKLDVNGGIAVGAYAGANLAPNNGMIISGNVGIGNVLGSAKLEITEANGEVLRTSFASDTSYYHSLLGNYSSTPANSYLAIKVNNGAAATQAEIMRLQGNGNVGIGTTSPTSGRLVVDGGGITFGTDDTYDIGVNGANRPNNIFVGTGDSSFMGRLGVGIATPGFKLHVNSDDTTATYAVVGNVNGGLLFGVTTSGMPAIYNFAAKGMVLGGNFNTSPTTQIAIDSLGNVGIGGDSTGAKFHVLGDANIRTNIAQFDVTITDFIIGTRYTNSNRRSFVAASFQLAAAVAGTAAVTFNVEQAGTTNKLTVSSGPLAGLTTIEPLALPVGPGAFYYFTDTSSGAGAVASIVAGTSSLTGF